MPVQFTKWNVQQPDSHQGQQPCVEMYSTGEWGDTGCYSVKQFVCKMPRCKCIIQSYLQSSCFSQRSIWCFYTISGLRSGTALNTFNFFIYIYCSIWLTFRYRFINRRCHDANSRSIYIYFISTIITFERRQEVSELHWLAWLIAKDCFHWCTDKMSLVAKFLAAWILPSNWRRQ